MRERLNDQPFELIAEYLLARLGLDAGVQRLELHAQEGQLVKGFANRGPMSVGELEQLGRRRVA